MIMEQQTVEQMKRQLIGEIKLTPSEVRKYYSQLSKDSLPNIPTTVRCRSSRWNQRSRLKRRMLSKHVFASSLMISTVGNMNSRHWPVCIQKIRNQPKGWRTGILGKTSLLPEFANVAFNLKDPKKISQIVQTEYGYHIIQLIEKRGDRINCRHILLKPKVSDKELNECMTRMDSLYNDLTAKKLHLKKRRLSSLPTRIREITKV